MMNERISVKVIFHTIDFEKGYTIKSRSRILLSSIVKNIDWYERRSAQRGIK